MERKNSFTGRARRLSNRWSVKLTDLLARGLITIGGIGTIVAVLMVLVFLLYVAFPLFLPTRLISPAVTSRSGEMPLLQDIDEHKILTWQLFADSRLVVQRFDNGQTVQEKQLFPGHQVTSVASYPEGDEVGIGLDDGQIVLGTLSPQVKFYRAADLPPTIAELQPGELAEHESGVVERTSQGMYRWQALEIAVQEPIKLGDSPITHIDFLKQSGEILAAAIDEQGQVTVVKIVETTNILGDVTQEATQQKVTLPAKNSGRPRRAFVTARNAELLVLWKDGQLARYELRGENGPQLVEEKSLANAELTAAIMLQGRDTLLVGDEHGNLSAWFTATSTSTVQGRRSLLRAHTLPALDSAVTSLARSRLLRMAVAGSRTGQLNFYFVTNDLELLSTRAIDGEIDAITIAPDDDLVLVQGQDQTWQSGLMTRHPEASFRALFRAVWYEGYPQPLHKWQSTTGGLEAEPKYSLLPLIFGTAKATFYSLLFGVPIALLAAVYSSEFVDPGVKAPLKSLIEMMASVPSVVLGFLAGLVFAPFVEDVLPTLLSAFFLIPFAFLLGAQLWQQLPHKAALQLAKYRLLAIGVVLAVGIVLSTAAAPLIQNWLFAGDFKSWLNQRRGSAAGGWFLLLLPLAAVLASLAANTYVNPWLRQRFGAIAREQFALVNLAKFLAISLLTIGVAYLAALAITATGWDSRGGLLDTYVQRNALVVGFVMGFAIIPIVYTISDDALSTVPQHLRSASLACGATPWQTTWRVVVPTAASGLFSAVMVGMGRAVGETMVMLMATGNVPLMEINIFNGFRTLSANIAEELGDATPWSSHFRILFLTGVLLLIVTLAINTVAEAIRISFRKRASQL
jgi:phosphate transport system permease protein